MTMPKDGGRVRRNKDADAREAARAHINRGMNQRAAMKAYHVGSVRFREAVEELLEERARRNGP